jgi:hypothetical protein
VVPPSWCKARKRHVDDCSIAMERVSRIKTATICPPEATMMLGLDATRLAA